MNNNIGLSNNLGVVIHIHKNARVFTTTSVLKVDDDLMTRLEKLLKKNRDLVNESKLDLFIKDRETMNKKLDDQAKKMVKFLETLGGNLNSSEKKDWENINERSERMRKLLNEKIDNLNTDDPLYNKNLFDLLQLHINNNVKQDDAMESIALKAVHRDMEETKAGSFAKQLFNSVRTKVLNERNEVLEANKELFQKEKEFFSKKDKEPSLIDDFANPALEQPSYMDPED